MIYSDPTGHFVLTAILIGMAIGAVVGFGVTTAVDYMDDGDVFNGTLANLLIIK